MRITINVKEKHAALIILFIIAASAIGLVVAYGGTNPQAVGHTWGEMVCDNTLCANTVNGNVGIGTASPSRKLVVDGTGLLIQGNNAAGTEYEDWPNPSLAIRRSDNYVANGITILSLGYRNDPLYSTDDSIFNIRLFDTTQAANAPTSAATTQLRIGGPGPIVLQANGGNVGIGTSTPTEKLDIQGGRLKIKGAVIDYVSGTNPYCPTGTGSIIVKWAPRTCSGSCITCSWGGGWVTYCGSPCTTSTAWSTVPPTCTYKQAAGEYDWCYDSPATCTASSWTEAICMGN